MFIITKNYSTPAHNKLSWFHQKNRSVLLDENNCLLIFKDVPQLKEYLASCKISDADMDFYGIDFVEIDPVAFISSLEMLKSSFKVKVQVAFCETGYRLEVVTNRNQLKISLYDKERLLGNIGDVYSNLEEAIKVLLMSVDLIENPKNVCSVCCEEDGLLSVDFDGTKTVICKNCLIDEAVERNLINEITIRQYYDKEHNLIGNENDISGVLKYLKTILKFTDFPNNNAEIRVADFDEDQSLYILSSLIGQNSISWGEIVEMQNKTAKDLWAEFNEVPTENNAITDDWYAFSKGTEYREICDWFENAFDTNIETDLMG